jgi:hypothetical protein
MGLSRSSSGLLVYDDFGSDTSANYIVEGAATVSMTGGNCSVSATNTRAVHTGSSGTKCVTVNAKRVSGDTRVGQAYYSANSTCETANDVDGYNAYGATTWGLGRLINAGATVLGTDSNDYCAEGEWGFTRVYLAAAGAVGRFGKTTLGQNITTTDTTYEAAGYGGFGVGGSAGTLFTTFESRTSHLITCTGVPTGSYLRVSDGTTAAEAQESSGTATVDAGAVLFPLASVGIYTASGGGGTKTAEILAATLADMGGGDAFAYSADGGAAVWLPFMRTQIIGRSFIGGR